MVAKITGIAFPFDRGPEGIPKTVEDADAVKSDLILLFSTPRGSRVMRPNFGVNIAQIVFDSTGSLLKAFLLREIAGAVGRFETRVQLLKVEVTEKKTSVFIDILYRVLGENDSLSMVIAKETGTISQA